MTMDKHIFYLKRDGIIIATGFYENRVFTVIKGSVSHYVSVLSPIMEGQEYTEEDLQFPSPSAAGCYCLGKKTCNGWIEWKDTEGRTLDDVYRSVD